MELIFVIPEVFLTAVTLILCYSTFITVCYILSDCIIAAYWHNKSQYNTNKYNIAKQVCNHTSVMQQQLFYLFIHKMVQLAPTEFQHWLKQVTIGKGTNSIENLEWKPQCPQTKLATTKCHHQILKHSHRTKARFHTTVSCYFKL